ncbi:MAG: DNA repair protein RecO [Pseudomonadota bacterium]
MTTRSIIMKKMDRGEADETVIFISRENGWLTGIAKNSRKSRVRFGGHLEPFCVVDLAIRSRKKDNMVWIDESHMFKGFLKIRGNMDSLARVCYFFELASVFLPEAQPDPNVFDFLENFLETLDSSNPGPIELMVGEIYLLGLLGFMPSFSNCPLCGQGFDSNAEAFFSPLLGGAVHRGCAEYDASAHINLSPATLAALRHGLNADSRLVGRIRLSTRAEKEIRASLSAFVRCLRGEDIKSLRFMENAGYV